ncbi:MAG: hypothetical protein GQ552_05305, partial [Flavobacteriaceae bacterium]|nr:hypothetical protein [Flavobacteriaceae bacterium]
MLKKVFLFFILIQFVSCSVNQKVLNLKKNDNQEFYYFSNGHLTQENYDFKTIKKEGNIAGEIIRASDASVWSGIATELKNPIQISNG